MILGLKDFSLNLEGLRKISYKVNSKIKPDENGKYNIQKCHNQYVPYGNNSRTIYIDLMNHLYNSIDGVTGFIEDIINARITLSKGIY